MKRNAYIFIILGLIFFSCSKNKTKETNETVIDTIPMLVMQIQKCSRLYTSEIQLHKIITHNDTKKLYGKFMKQDFSIDLPFGKRRIAIPIEASIKSYIEFGNFSEHNIRKRGKQIEIILPDPKLMLTSTKIDRKEVKQNIPILRGHFTDEELTAYERQGRDSILKDIAQLDILENARLSAARILIPMVTQMGFSEKDITVTFRKEFNVRDLLVIPKSRNEKENIITNELQ